MFLCQVDVNEAPEMRSAPYFNFSENLPIGSSVYNATLFDVDAGDSVSTVIVGGNSNNGFPAFAVDSQGRVTTASLHDFESGQRTYLLQLVLTDVGPAGPAPLVGLLHDPNHDPGHIRVHRYARSRSWSPQLAAVAASWCDALPLPSCLACSAQSTLWLHVGPSSWLL
jgi:hypothetical protein